MWNMTCSVLILSRQQLIIVQAHPLMLHCHNGTMWVKRPSPQKRLARHVHYNNVNSNMVASKITAVATMVMEEWQWLSSWDWLQFLVQHPWAMRLRHSAMWNSLAQMTLEINLHIWKHHLNAVRWKQIEWWESGETVTGSAMANVINGSKISFVVTFSGFLNGKFSYTGTH